MPRTSSPRRLPAAVLAAGLLLGALGCGGSDEGGSSSTTTEAGGSGTEVTESVPTSPPSTEVSQPTAYTSTAEDAVNELKAAWETGDRTRAALVAPGDVVEALFGVPSEGFEIYGCDTGEFPTSNCNFRNRSTGVSIKVTSARSDAGWQISTITVA